MPTITEKLEGLLKDAEGWHDGNVGRTMVSGKEHVLQAATRAFMDRASNEEIVVALVHDLGRSFDEEHHGAAIADFLEDTKLPKPYIEALRHHSEFQDTPYSVLTAKYGTQDWYPVAVRLSAWDALSFDPNFPTRPFKDFRSTLKYVLEN